MPVGRSLESDGDKPTMESSGRETICVSTADAQTLKRDIISTMLITN